MYVRNQIIKYCDRTLVLGPTTLDRLSNEPSIASSQIKRLGNLTDRSTHLGTDMVIACAQREPVHLRWQVCLKSSKKLPKIILRRCNLNFYRKYNIVNNKLANSTSSVWSNESSNKYNAVLQQHSKATAVAVVTKGSNGLNER